jgi:hypothetical protein
LADCLCGTSSRSVVMGGMIITPSEGSCFTVGLLCGLGRSALTMNLFDMSKLLFNVLARKETVRMET